MSVRTMTVGTRLLIGFFAIALSGAIVAGIGIVNMGKIHEMGEQMYERELLGLSSIKEANISLVYVGRGLRSMLLASTDAERAKHAARVETRRVELHQHLAEAEKRFYSPAGREHLARLRQELAAYETDVLAALERAKTEPLQERRELAAFVVEGMRRKPMPLTSACRAWPR